MLKFSYIVLFLLLTATLSAQLVTAHCVHSSGVRFLLDAYLGALGACNCQRTGVYLFDFPKCNTDPYILEFEDNFDGDSLDLTKWQNIPHGQGALQGAQRIDISMLKNAIVSDGVCHLTARKERVLIRAVSWKNDDEILSDGLKNLRYYDNTSCTIFSRQKFHHGKFEIRSRMPIGNGFWPAFWLFGGERYNEIDIFDSYGGINELITSIGHDFEEKSVSGCNHTKRGFDLSEWHTFSCEWEETKIVFAIDGKPFRIIHRVISAAGEPVSCGDNVASGSYFQLKAFTLEPMNLILDLFLTGENGPGGSVPIDSSTPFPSSFDVDYVRYWKRQPRTIVVYPNPTTNKIYVKSTAPILQYALKNLWGDMLENNYKPSENFELDLQRYSDGIYILTVYLEGSSKNFKILKTNH